MNLWKSWFRGVAAVVVLALGLAGPLRAAQLPVVYVATNGLDSNSGKYTTQPVKTIQHGLDLAAAGGTVILDRGTYNLTGTITVTNGITLIGRLSAKYQILNGDTTYRIVRIATGFVENVSLTRGHTSMGDIGGGGAEIVVGALRNSRVYNNFVYGTAGTGGGLALSGPNALVENCYVYSNSASFEGGGIAIYTFPGAIQVVRNCLVWTNTAFSAGGGIRVRGYHNAGNSVEISECTVVKNVGANEAGGLLIQRTEDGPSLYCNIRNSIIYFNHVTGTYPDRHTNVYWGYLSSDSTITYSDSFPLESGDGNINGNPKFQSASNFRLQSSSPCVNTGINADDLAETDIDNSTRLRIINGHVDMGCYESLY